jgi:hypothetical protein
MSSRNSLVLAFVSTLVFASTSFAAAFTNGPTIDMNDDAGGGDRPTFLKLMETRVKPAMDALATGGYEICTAADVDEAYAAADAKVRRRIDPKTVRGIVDQLDVRLKGRKVTLSSLPGEIGAVAPSVDRYDIATFLGLACGGGVRVDFAKDYYSVNVHYDVTDERSGRSFGVGDGRGANDASDKDYLDELEAYSRGARDNLPAFYRALLESLLVTDGSAFADVTSDGRAVLTDFLAVYVAEQARNLMDGTVAPYWDAALLEVTLLAGFHAGQGDMKLYYKNIGTGAVSFTDRTLRQKACAAPTAAKSASLSDYWQFSRNITDPANCRRSGINITNGEFRKLGAAITAYVRAKHPATYDKVKAALGLTSNPTNLYNSLSKYLIGGAAPRTLSAARAADVTSAWLELLAVVTDEAGAISAGL